MERIAEDGFVLHLKESVNLASSGKSVREVMKWKKFYNVKLENVKSVDGKDVLYQYVSGEYHQVVGFIGEIFDMSVIEVMCDICDNKYWVKDKKRCR